MISDKLYEPLALTEVVSSLRERNKKIVFTNGCFDILHKGHVLYLEEAAKLGDILIVAVNTDERVRSLKGENRPINTMLDRMLVLGALSSTTYITYFTEDTPKEIILLLKPDIHVKASEYEVDNMPETPAVRSYGGKVVMVKYHEGYSTTAIIGKK